MDSDACKKVVNFNFIINCSPQPEKGKTETKTKGKKRKIRRESPVKIVRNKLIATILAALHKGGGFSEASAVDKERLIKLGRSVSGLKLSNNLESSAVDFLPTTKKAIDKLIKNRYIKECKESYYLTPSGRRNIEQKLEFWDKLDKIKKKDINIIMDNENVGDKKEEEKDDDEEEEEKEGEEDNDDDNDNDNDDDDNNEDDNGYPVEDGAFILAILFLRNKNIDKLSFTKDKIIDEIRCVHEEFPSINFNRDEEILARNIVGGYIVNNSGNFSLTEEGMEIANNVYDKCSFRVDELLIKRPKHE